MDFDGKINCNQSNETFFVDRTYNWLLLDIEREIKERGIFYVYFVNAFSFWLNF